MTNIDNFKNTKVLVVGFGKSGIAATQALLKLGAVVSVQDSKSENEIDKNLMTFFVNRGVEFYTGTIPLNMRSFDMLVLSPGVNPELDFISEAVKSGIEVTGELEIAYRIGKGNYIAITGTNGKTTVTSLVGEIFKLSGRKTYVVGNIGVAVISESARAQEKDWLVTECSSFQLETTKYFKPVVSAILNLTPDHLDRHHGMRGYGEAKAKIFANQTENEYLVINKDDPACYKLAAGCKAQVAPFSIKEKLKVGAFVNDGEVQVVDFDGNKTRICALSDIKIIGKHNISNVVAAAGICHFAGIKAETIADGIRAFNGVEHRIEYCGQYDGVKYYNDSKGTNTAAAITAIKAVGKNIILIAGGDGKEQDFSPLASELAGRVKKLILLGRDAELIERAANKTGFYDCVRCADMRECVAKASESATEGDSVLLSPACASWDMYGNYEQRGEHFKRCIAELMG